MLCRSSSEKATCGLGSFSNDERFVLISGLLLEFLLLNEGVLYKSYLIFSTYGLTLGFSLYTILSNLAEEEIYEEGAPDLPPVGGEPEGKEGKEGKKKVAPRGNFTMTDRCSPSVFLFLNKNCIHILTYIEVLSRNNLVSRRGRFFRITDRYFHDRRAHLRYNLFIHIIHTRTSHSIALLPVKL